MPFNMDGGFNTLDNTAIVVTITAPTESTINQPVTLTANITGQDARKTLNGGVFTIDRPVPYELSVTRKDGTVESYAVIANNDGVIGAYPVSSKWFRGSDGKLIFGNDNQAIEGL
jgi:hypothetical protein